MRAKQKKGNGTIKGVKIYTTSTIPYYIEIMGV